MGFNPSEMFRSAHEAIYGSKQGIVMAKVVGFLAARLKNILTKFVNSEELMKALTAILLKKRRAPYYPYKHGRFLRGERCFNGPDCKFCIHELLLWILADLHHKGPEGARKKKELAKGKSPSHCNKEELEIQTPWMHLTCRSSHRLFTALERQQPREEGWDTVPEEYVYRRAASLSGRVSLFESVNSAMKKYLLSLETHDRCLIRGDRDMFENLSTMFDYHHITASLNVLLRIGDKTFIIETKKLFEIGCLRDAVSDETVSGLFYATVLEILKIRVLDCQYHLLWHTLYAFRMESPLKEFFESEWPFVEKNGYLEYTGDTAVLLDEMEISVDDLESACNNEGYCGLPVCRIFSDAMKRQLSKRHALNRRNRGSFGGDGDSEEEDDDLSINSQEEDEAPEEKEASEEVEDGDKSGEVSNANENDEEMSVAAENKAITKARKARSFRKDNRGMVWESEEEEEGSEKDEEKEEDVVMADDGDVVSTVSSVAASENEEEEKRSEKDEEKLVVVESQGDVDVSNSSPIAAKNNEDADMTNDDKRGEGVSGYVAVEDKNMSDAFTGIEGDGEASSGVDEDVKFTQFDDLTEEQCEEIIESLQNWDEYCRKWGLKNEYWDGRGEDDNGVIQEQEEDVAGGEDDNGVIQEEDDTGGEDDNGAMQEEVVAQLRTMQRALVEMFTPQQVTEMFEEFGGITPQEVNEMFEEFGGIAVHESIEDEEEDGEEHT